MKALVTGGAGFIGSHLVDRLINEGYDTIVLDNYSTGRPENLKQHKNNPKLQLVEVDIRNLELIKPYFKDVNWVFHLAALADIVPSIVKPLHYFASNVDGTMNILEAARTARIEKFVYAASSSCYGIPDEYPTKETAEIRCEYPYALTKNLGEQCAFHWGKVYKIPVISLRFFNIYGPRARTSGTYGAVFGIFLAQKINNKPLTIIGDGSQTRDFTFVTDAVEALITAAKSKITREAFNVGSGGTYSIDHLADLLGGKKTYIPKRPGEPDCTFADIRKIKQQLGWSPKVKFEEGVKIMLDHIDSWRGAPVWTKDSIVEVTKDWFKYLARK